MAQSTSTRQAGRPDYAIFVTTVALVVIGLIFVYSSSFAIALAAYGNVNYFIIRQLAAALAGFVLMYFLMRFDYHRLRYMSPLLMLVAMLSLFAVLVVGEANYGARRWVAVGSLPPLQPSEFAKLAIIIYISAWLVSRGPNVRSFALGFMPFVLLVSVVSVLVLLEPDTGTAAIIVLTTVTLFFIAGASFAHLLALGAAGSVTSLLLVLAEGYRADRLFAFASAEQEPTERGFHILQLLIALGSGGIKGLGLGVSRQKFFYIPGAHTDGVFAIIGEETGFIGAMLVIALFAFLVYRGLRVAMMARDDFGRYIAIGIVAWIAYQTLINLGGITRSIPLTGIPLPFVSYGGSSLIVLMAAIGVLLNVSRYTTEQKYIERPRQRRTQARSPAVAG